MGAGPERIEDGGPKKVEVVACQCAEVDGAGFCGARKVVIGVGAREAGAVELCADVDDGARVECVGERGGEACGVVGAGAPEDERGVAGGVEGAGLGAGDDLLVRARLGVVRLCGRGGEGDVEARRVGEGERDGAISRRGVGVDRQRLAEQVARGVGGFVGEGARTTEQGVEECAFAGGSWAEQEDGGCGVWGEGCVGGWCGVAIGVGGEGDAQMGVEFGEEGVQGAGEVGCVDGADVFLVGEVDAGFDEGEEMGEAGMPIEAVLTQ